jgi:ATP-binding cassette, subfamily B, heavy metal transporter
MTQPAPPTAPRKAGLQTVLRFLPLLWPKGEGELKVRVVAALVLVLAGKAIGLTVPYALKWVVDSMSGARAAPTLILA